MSQYSQLEIDPQALGTAELPAQINAPEECLPERQYCVFRVGLGYYCLSVLEVEEVVDWPAITRVPLAPPFLLGVFNLRGVIVPAVDIANGDTRPSVQLPKQLVVAAVRGEGEHGDLRLGLAADEVVGTYSTSEPLLVEEAPRTALQCCGVLRYHDRLALVLELRRLTEAFPIPVI